MKQGRNILKKLTYPALHWFCRFSQALLLEMYHLTALPEVRYSSQHLRSQNYATVHLEYAICSKAVIKTVYISCKSL